MADKETIPTKVYSRLDISPASKNRICVICSLSVENADVRRRLFCPSSQNWQKTKACLSLEFLLGVELDRNSVLTDIICRKCFDRNETLVKKIVNVREGFECSKKKLYSERCTAYTKRMGKDDADDVWPTARKSLFQADCGVKNPSCPAMTLLKTRLVSTETVSGSTKEKGSESLSVSSVEVRYIYLAL